MPQSRVRAGAGVNETKEKQASKHELPEQGGERRGSDGLAWDGALWTEVQRSSIYGPSS